MGRIPVIFSANIAGFESASFDGVTMDNFGRIVSFHWPGLLGKMINCRAARVGPSQRVEARPRAALSCAAAQHFVLLGRSPVLGPTAALRGGVSCRVQQTRNDGSPQTAYGRPNVRVRRPVPIATRPRCGRCTARSPPLGCSGRPTALSRCGLGQQNNSYQSEGAPIEGREVTSATARCPKALVILLESEDKLESSPIVVALKRARR